jgi:hypothetical protein
MKTLLQTLINLHLGFNVSDSDFNDSDEKLKNGWNFEAKVESINLYSVEGEEVDIK